MFDIIWTLLTVVAIIAGGSGSIHVANGSSTDSAIGVPIAIHPIIVVVIVGVTNTLRNTLFKVHKCSSATGTGCSFLHFDKPF